MHAPRTLPPTPLLLLALALLVGCQDQELPTAPAPEGAAFDHQSGSCEVSNTQDSGEGSLRHAVQTDACSEITFASTLNGQSITLTSGQLTINRDLVVTGPGADLLTVSGNNSSRVFEIGSFGATQQPTVTISGLTITDGSAGFGGGIFNYGTLALTHSTVSGNSAQTGGGVWNGGALQLTSSTVSGNSADNGGGIYSTNSPGITVVAQAWLL